MGDVMELGVNYSRAAADLLASRQIAIDRFKCPAWPDLVERVRQICPTYVHLPLVAGRGRGGVIDSETRAPADWASIEALLATTGTPYVNIHLAPGVQDHPAIPLASTAPAHVERVTEALIRDVGAVVARLGAERVIVENDHDNGGRHLRAAFLPEVIRAVAEVTGCGLLLDLSHARLAAHRLGRDAWDYLAALPLARTREVHLTGLQVFDERWSAFFGRDGLPAAAVAPLVGRLIDHLPLTDEDWAFTRRALERVRQGSWGTPWIVALEYGGVGPVWEASTDIDILREQVPRLAALVGAVAAPPPPGHH
jgi:uncharacterized protein